MLTESTLISLKAKAVAKTMKKGVHQTKKNKVWNKTTFRLPKTLEKKRTPKVLSKSVKKQSTWDKYAVVKYPRATESAIKTIEDHNTLVFIVHKSATKPTIRKACQELYAIKVKKVNTLITARGDKKAYVILSKEHDALEVANKIGIM